ncbi:gp663 [Bacillus phage G]|uniref:Gp663 n=1 Tax=Bacillus phage G TaxID=2884420 RepID=G3MB43_9CAUD|nr:gp663 [Bacillus phage G]AEO93906.1 gp663 [Bacillus phage G]
MYHNIDDVKIPLMVSFLFVFYLYNLIVYYGKHIRSRVCICTTRMHLCIYVLVYTYVHVYALAIYILTYMYMTNYDKTIQ